MPEDLVLIEFSIWYIFCLGHFKTFLMKKVYFLLIFTSLFVFYSLTAYADSTEKVRVIKEDKNAHDLIVERTSGERYLLQHSPLCSSMSTEFPVYLLWVGEKIDKLKVASNEICTVYKYAVYGGDITISKRIKSDNLLIKEHLAEMIWKGDKYEVDYEKGCENIRDFEGKQAYVDKSGSLTGSSIYLPSNRGSCKVRSAKFLEKVDTGETTIESPIKNLQYKAENNEAYFYWDKDTGGAKWVYLISRSRYQVNPDDYNWDQMPLLKTTINNSYTAIQLMNNVEYFFYLSARNEKGEVAPWTELKIKPIKTAVVFENNPDPEEFEISLKENTDSSFTLSWPDKSEKTSRYTIEFFVNGKREFFKIISGQLSEYQISKKPEYKGANLRFTLLSIPKSIYDVHYQDGIYWEEKAE